MIKLLTALLAVSYLYANTIPFEKEVCSFMGDTPVEVNFELNSSENTQRQEQIRTIAERLIEKFEKPVGEYLKGKRRTLPDDPKLVFEFLWDDERINAYATFTHEEDYPVIKMTGGMALHPDLTLDGVTLILCHEIGHFMGGAPRQRRGNTQRLSWSSAEGQADYFATSWCLKEMWESEIQAPNHVKLLTWQVGEVRGICDNPLCERIAQASLNTSELFAKLKFQPTPMSLEDRDPSNAYDTILDHPKALCRLETMVNGLRCPGLKTFPFNWNDSTKNDCRQDFFQRPSCWYAN